MKQEIPIVEKRSKEGHLFEKDLRRAEDSR